MMGLRLQETCCSSQVLKLWRYDQETSEEGLFIKARQKSQQNPFYRNLMLKLDKFSSLDIYKDFFLKAVTRDWVIECKKWPNSLFSP